MSQCLTLRYESDASGAFPLTKRTISRIVDAVNPPLDVTVYRNVGGIKSGGKTTEHEWMLRIAHFDFYIDDLTAISASR